jgi:hypothetical protein
MQTNDGALVNEGAYDRATAKVKQALELLAAARGELQSWAPPTAINDLEAAEAILKGLPARLPPREK